MSRPGPAAAPDRLVVYVDGFNLYHGLHAQTGCRLLWLDLVALARRLRPRSELVAVKYFTVQVLDDAEALSRQQTYWNALSALYGEQVEVVKGRYQRKSRRCRECGAEWEDREEKGTDVNIAVNLVADAARHAMNAALVVSADSDLVPAVRTAKTLNPELFIAAAFPPQRKSAHLRHLMPASFPLKESRLRQSLLPDVVTTSDGRAFMRPEKWH